MAKGLVERHGGRLEACSDGPGRGSEFVVRAPLLQDGGSEAVCATAATGLAAQGEAYCILIADDLIVNADSLALLQLDGHPVCVAYDGEQAVALPESVRPDVALLDLAMPKLNGLQASRRIR